MPLIFQSMIYRTDLHSNRDVLYLFGDNEERRGLGGQAAEMRGERNAHGIRVKKAPSMDKWALWTDEDYERVVPLIKADLEKPYRYIGCGRTVVVPLAGLGTERAALEYAAPKILDYLVMKLGTLRELGEQIRRDQEAEWVGPRELADQGQAPQPDYTL